MKQKLEQYIFSENLFVYAILDGAAVPDLPMRFFEMQPQHVCLYRGELDADLAEVAPYLVNLQRGARFTDWLLAECWGKHWGIFVHSLYPITEMRKHFRRFLTVHDENGNPMLFRYYDPRVLPKFLPSCQPDELGMFFANVKTFFAESVDAGELVRLQFVNKALKQTGFELRESFVHAMPPPNSYSGQNAEFNYA